MAIFKNLVVSCSSQKLLQWDGIPAMGWSSCSPPERRVLDPEHEHPWELQDAGTPSVLL